MSAIHEHVRLHPRFAKAYVYWDAETVNQHGHCGRIKAKCFTAWNRTQPGTLAVNHKAAVHWLLAEDKKVLRRNWYRDSGALTDKQLAPEDLDLPPDPKQWFGVPKEPIVIESLTIHPVYLCPKTALFWLPRDEAPPQPNGALFVLREQPTHKRYRFSVEHCGEDNAQCYASLIGWNRSFMPRIPKRSFITTKVAAWRLWPTEWRLPFNLCGMPAEIKDPRAALYETPQDANRAIKRWVTTRTRNIRKHRRPLTRREQLFFRMMAGAAAIQKQVSLN